MENNNSSLENICWVVYEDYQEYCYGETHRYIRAVFTDKVKADEYKNMLQSKDKRRNSGDYDVMETALNPT